jgi:hypothetical protein
MPSKLFTYALTGKPILACLHENSQANAYFERTPELGYLMHFDGDSRRGDEDRVVRQYLHDVADHRTTDRSAAIAQYLSPSAARRHAEFFETCVGRPAEQRA